MLKKLSYFFIFLLTFHTSANAHSTANTASNKIPDKTTKTELLPLGDGHVSTSPKVGYIFSCQSSFNGGGAFRDGDWIIGDHWNPAAKPTVQGSVMWPDHYFSLKFESAKLLIKSNDLPDHATGTFPIASGDPAYYFDRNPNAISAQLISLNLPTQPKIAAQPSCLPMGMIGIALTGIAIFNGLDGQGRDAAAHEIQDSCNGHPERQGTYHYHNMSPCMKDEAGKKGMHSDLAGYALDGFGIYGQKGEKGEILTNKNLDVCHGHSHLLNWNGVDQKIYHYHLTKEYPYTLGCFRGEISQKGKTSLPAKEDGPWHPRSNGPIMVLEKVAKELGIDQGKLQKVIGPPPPNFSRAARELKIDEDKLRDAFERARRSVEEE